MQKNILFEDKHIIVVYKPAGIATQTARIGQQDMVSELKNYLAENSPPPRGDASYLGIVHRLDQPVSGLLVFAKTRAAAAELGRQITGGHMQKYYHAVVQGHPEQEQGTLENFLYRDGKTNRSLIVGKDFPEAKKAVLDYRLIKSLMVLEEDMGYKAYAHTFRERHSANFSKDREISLMEIHLLTGRHHQIRVQMAGADMPLLGDSKYGSPGSKALSQKARCRNVALCASRLIFHHPVTQEELSFQKQPEEEIFLPFFTERI